MDTNDKINVLFTGAGGSGTIYILKKFKEMPEYRTTVVDMNQHAVGLHVADKGYVVPPVLAENYFEVIKKIVEKENITILVPLIDEEILGMLELGKTLNIPVLVPEKQFIELTLDKLKTSNELKKLGLPTPNTWTYEEFEKIKNQGVFPKIVKPIVGRGSRGFAQLKTISDYEEYMKNTTYDKKDLIIQDFIEGTEYTVSVVAAKDGRTIAVVPKEIILKKGITKAGVTRENKTIDDLCRKIQEKLKGNGPFNVQLIIDKQNIPYVIEINPRYSTTVTLTIEAGINEVDLLIKDKLGIEQTEPKTFKKNLVMLRYEDQIFLDEKNLTIEKI